MKEQVEIGVHEGLDGKGKCRCRGRMPLGFALVVATMICLVLMSICSPETASATEYNYVAHRGIVNSKYPGNTLNAFHQAASTIGIWGIETDVYRTKDGNWVCIHGRAGVEAEWQGMDVLKTDCAKLVAKKDPAGYSLPTLEQYLDECKNGGKVAVIELKDQRIGKEAGFAKDLVRVVHSKGMLNQSMFISFQAGSVSKVKKFAKTMYNCNVRSRLCGNITSIEGVDKKIALALKHGIGGISCPFRFLDYATKKVKGTGLQLHGGGGNEAMAREAAEKYGVASSTVEWTPQKYTVTFKDGVTGKTIKTVKTAYKHSVTPPSAPSHTGYTFSKWSPSTSSVTDNMTSTAQYSISKYSVTFKDGVDGKIISTEKVAHGSPVQAPAAPVHTGYTFSKWDKSTASVTDKMTVTAVYKANKYLVTFVDGLTGKTISATNVAHGKETKAPDVPSHIGYKFSKWQGKYSNVTSARTVTATYDVNEYTVKFKDGITGADMTSIQVKHGKKASAPAARQHTGYVFKQWDQDLSSITADTVVTSVYTARAYKVTYHVPAETTAPAPATFFYGKGLATLAAAPSNASGTFLGWHTAETGGTKVTSIGADVAADVDLYARYITDKYTVKYNPNGGNGISQDIVAECGAAVTLSRCPYQKTVKLTLDAGDGKAATLEHEGQSPFLGWALSPEGPVAYAGGTTIGALSNEKGAVVTLYAQWGPATVSLPIATKENSVFDGWCTARNGGEKAGDTGSTYTFSSPITLYARYIPLEKDPYTIQYELDGGVLDAGNPGQYTESSDDIVLNKPVKLGYVFAGWTGTGLDVSTTDVVIPKGSSGNRAYTATWTSGSYDIGFDANGGMGSMTPVHADVDAVVELPACSFTMDNHSFAGWAASPDGPVLYSDTGLVKNVIYNGKAMLYAKWLFGSPAESAGELSEPAREDAAFDNSGSPISATNRLSKRAIATASLVGDVSEFELQGTPQVPLAPSSFSGQPVAIELDNNGAAGAPATTKLSLLPDAIFTFPKMGAKDISYTVEDDFTHMERSGTAELSFVGWRDGSGRIWKAGTTLAAKRLSEAGMGTSFTATWEPAVVSLPELSSPTAVFAGWHDSSLNVTGVVGEHLVSQDTSFTSRWQDKGVVEIRGDVFLVRDWRRLNGAVEVAGTEVAKLPLALPDASEPLSVVFDEDTGALPGLGSPCVSSASQVSWASSAASSTVAYAPGAKLGPDAFNSHGLSVIYPMALGKLSVTCPATLSGGKSVSFWADDHGNVYAPGAEYEFSENTVLHTVLGEPIQQQQGQQGEKQQSTRGGSDVQVAPETPAPSSAQQDSETLGNASGYDAEQQTVLPDENQELVPSDKMTNEREFEDASEGLNAIDDTVAEEEPEEEISEAAAAQESDSITGEGDHAVPPIETREPDVPTKENLSGSDNTVNNIDIGSTVDNTSNTSNTNNASNTAAPVRQPQTPTVTIPAKPVVTQMSATAISGLSDQTYTGFALKPKPVVKHGSKTLSEGTDYTLSYSSNVNAGTATVKVTGKGGYTGAVAKTFKVKPASISKATVSDIKKKYYYTGTKINPSPTVKFNGKKLSSKSDYGTSYSNKLTLGTGTGKVTITGKGNFTGTKSVSFNIENMGDDLARQACKISYSRKVKGGTGTKKYIAACKAAGCYSSPYYGRSCIFGMSTAARTSGYDPSFPKYNWGDVNSVTSRSYFHYKANGYQTPDKSKKSSRWTCVGTYPADKSKLLPGDVLLVLHANNSSSNHIWMYVGNKIAKEVYASDLKGTDADKGVPTGAWVQSHGSSKSAPSIEGANTNYDKSPNPVRIYRCTNPKNK